MALRTLVIAFGAVLVAAAPAAAGTNSKAEKANAEQTGTSKAAQETKYCLKEVITGTHMESKDCRTKAQWAQEGIDIEQFAKKK